MSKGTQTQQAIRQLLESGQAATQVQLQKNLEKIGVHITQASISRALQKLGAVKTRKPDGSIAYKLLPNQQGSIRERLVHDLVDKIFSNGSLIIIHTKPDSAKYVTQYIDDKNIDLIGGTLAGENTIFVAPKNMKDLSRLTKALVDLLQ